MFVNTCTSIVFFFNRTIERLLEATETYTDIQTGDTEINRSQLNENITQHPEVPTNTPSLTKEIDIFRVPQEIKDQAAMRRLREEHKLDNFRFDEGCQMQYARKKHTCIMLYDCKKCNYIGPNINDAHRHTSKEHKYEFKIEELKDIIEGKSPSPSIEIEAICIPALFSENKELIKILCPVCKTEIREEDIKSHFMEHLRKLQQNNLKKVRENTEYERLNPINIIYRFISEVKNTQVVRTAQMIGRRTMGPSRE